MEQAHIIRTLGVAADFDPADEVRRRVDFLKGYLLSSGAKGFVLGISGGVDSLVAGMLAQTAVQEIRDEGGDARFLAVRLPYGTQADEDDARLAMETIGPDSGLTVDIRPAADAMLSTLKTGGMADLTSERQDFLLGNIKARQRMIAQYALAGAMPGLVIGTDHAAEALMGFYTKFGDGAADVLPLSGLNKRRVRAVGTFLGAPERLVSKVPTADLESDKPLLPDEEAFGVTYEQIDDFLEGKDVDAVARDIIFDAYRKTEHKRQLPAAL